MAGDLRPKTETCPPTTTDQKGLFQLAMGYFEDAVAKILRSIY